MRHFKNYEKIHISGVKKNIINKFKTETIKIFDDSINYFSIKEHKIHKNFKDDFYIICDINYNGQIEKNIKIDFISVRKKNYYNGLIFSKRLAEKTGQKIIKKRINYVFDK